MEETKIVCITPIKNEGWILKNFLMATSLWADHIIIADQNSTDNSRHIANSFSKVKLIDNNSEAFNEPDRQLLLLNEARKIKGKKLIIALDADEFFTPECLEKDTWEEMKNLPPGTVVSFKWANVRPDTKYYWEPSHWMPLGYVDDGSKHKGKKIHSPRIPIKKDANEYKHKQIKVMHLQYINWDRMKSKHRWYQCWELLNNSHRSAISIYRQYHHMYEIREKDLTMIPHFWVSEYKKRNIDIFKYVKDEFYWWDEEVIKFIDKYGAQKFSKLSIWDIDWQYLASKFGYKNIRKFIDPRSSIDINVQDWLYNTQPIKDNNDIKLKEKEIRAEYGY